MTKGIIGKFFFAPILFDSISEIDVIQVDGGKEKNQHEIDNIFHCENG